MGWPFTDKVSPAETAAPAVEYTKKTRPVTDEVQLKTAFAAYNKVAPEPEAAPAAPAPAPEPLARPFSQRIRARLAELPAAVRAVDQIWSAIHGVREAEAAEDLMDYDRYMRMHFAIQRVLLPAWGVSEAAQRAKRDWEVDRQGGRGVARSRFRESVLHIASTRARGNLQNPTDEELDQIALRSAVFLWHLLHAVTVVEKASGERRLRRPHETTQGALAALTVEQLQLEAEDLQDHPAFEDMVNTRQPAAPAARPAAPSQPAPSRPAPRGPPAPPLQRDLAWLAALNRIKRASPAAAAYCS